MQNADTTTARNISGGVWLVTDLCINIFAQSIVKWLGLDYPTVQIVFLRASVGLIIIVPWIWHSRARFKSIDHWPLHLTRVALSALVLTTSFFAIARLPFALVTAIGFTRPIMTMIMALVFLREIIPPKRWVAAGIAFVGVLIAVQPGTLPFSWGIPAMGLTVIFASVVTVITRHLRNVPTIVMMTFYTAGLSLLTVPFALYYWVDIATDHLLPLLAIGVFSQCAQFCFLIAYQRAEAAFLAILSYTSLLLTTGVGYFVFDEVPSIAFVIGAALIIAAAAWTTLSARKVS